MKSKLLAVLMSVAMISTLFTGCGSSSSDDTSSDTTADTTADASDDSSDVDTSEIEITVWCPEEALELTESQLAAFNAEYGTEITFTVEAVSEADAATNMITDVTAGADLYFFAQDQLNRLVKAGALTQVSTSIEEEIAAANDSASVEAVTSADGGMWAFPLTSDNCYFVYYDKSVITDESVLLNQTDLIAACEAAGKTLCFEITDSVWYSASYFFATGCESTWTYDADGNATDVTDTFDSDAGIIACKGIAELVSSSAFVNSAEASEFESDAAVVVSGTWSSSTVSEILGDNMGVTVLWSFTVDGTDYQLSPFTGNKLLGVKPQTDAVKAAYCQLVAQWLSNEECQLERFESNGWGPSNTNAQNSEAVLADEVLAVVTATGSFAIPQGSYPNAWWDAGKVIGASVQALGTADPSDDDLAAILATYQSNLDNILSTTFKGWVLVGDCDINWDCMGGDEAGDGSGKYCLGEDNNTYDSYSSESPYVGIWEVEVDYTGEWGFRFVIYGDWTGGTYDSAGVGYSHLDLDNSVACTEGSDNNIMPDAGSGTYIVTIDTTGDEPVVTVTAK